MLRYAVLHSGVIENQKQTQRTIHWEHLGSGDHGVSDDKWVGAGNVAFSFKPTTISSSVSRSWVGVKEMGASFSLPAAGSTTPLSKQGTHVHLALSHATEKYFRVQEKQKEM